eukprot:TRINITY_DN9604_c0_g1_i1.p1 TRINITY_DN9604_c0_g1~~TRINITY_DN9604_c0_g1_i1.p1  ORF type:complete len:137 (-),score=4.66 TRINITY_DN9604_c0_g1_i1:28-438(-)
MINKTTTTLNLGNLYQQQYYSINYYILIIELFIFFNLLFHIDENLIREKGSEFIAAALKSNSTLTTLNLRNNYIGNKGVEIITIAFNLNKTIKKIDLIHNNIGNQDLILVKKPSKNMLQRFQKRRVSQQRVRVCGG